MSVARRLQRLLQVLRLMQSGRIQTSRQLAAECRVSQRTIFRDLQCLQEAGIHPQFSQERRGFLLPGSWEAPDQQLTPLEAASVYSICFQMGSESSGLPFHGLARNASLKVLGSLPGRYRKSLQETGEAQEIWLDAHNPLEASQKIYEQFLQAMLSRQQVRIRYTGASDPAPLMTLLSPYRLLFVRRSWYVVGRSTYHRSVRTFNLGRIIEATSVESRYEIPPRFSLKSYLGNAWGIVRGHPRSQNVVLKFEKLVAINVSEVRWHKSQSLRRFPDGTLEFRVVVDGFQEIIWWILGYGDQVEVVEPKELRQLVRDRLKNAIKKYR